MSLEKFIVCFINIKYVCMYNVYARINKVKSMLVNGKYFTSGKKLHRAF